MRRGEIYLVKWSRISVIAGKFPPDWSRLYQHCQAAGMPNDEPNYWLPVIDECWHRLFGKALTEEELIKYFYLAKGMSPDGVKSMTLAELASNLRNHLVQIATKEATKGEASGTSEPVKRDKKTDARNKWIYEQCFKGVEHDKIVSELKRIASGKKWRIVSTKQRIQQIGIQYADENDLPRPPARREL